MRAATFTELQPVAEPTVTVLCSRYRLRRLRAINGRKPSYTASAQITKTAHVLTALRRLASLLMTPQETYMGRPPRAVPGAPVEDAARGGLCLNYLQVQLDGRRPYFTTSVRAAAFVP